MSAETAGLDVLLVEDDVAIADMYRIKLEAEGCHVRTAADGPGGLRQALACPPQVLLLDVRLPGFDGLDLLSRLRGDPNGAQVPVVMLTNFAEDDVVRRGVGLGALAHLVKSQTTPAQLFATLLDLLAAARQGSG